MEQMPYLSIIMPVHNAGTYLEDAVASVLGQDFPDFELICVNDASTDGSAALLEAMAGQDSRVTLLHTPENVGAGEARNLGLDAARGQYIGFMDADDTLPPGIFSAAVGEAQATGADEIKWGLREIHLSSSGEVKKEIEILPEAGVYTGAEIPAAVAKLEGLTLFGYQWNALYRAEVIRENRIRFTPAVLYEDFFFNLDFIRCAESLSVLRRDGYRYYKRGNSVTSRFVPDYFDLSAERIRRMLVYLKDAGCADPEAFAMLKNRLLRYCLSAWGRNAGKQAGLSAAEQKNRVLQMRGNETVRALAFNRSLPTAPPYLAARWLLTRGAPGMAVLAGKLIAALRP